jgi:hypothetical protein
MGAPLLLLLEGTKGRAGMCPAEEDDGWRVGDKRGPVAGEMCGDACRLLFALPVLAAARAINEIPAGSVLLRPPGARTPRAELAFGGSAFDHVDEENVVLPAAPPAPTLMLVAAAGSTGELKAAAL